MKKKRQHKHMKLRKRADRLFFPNSRHKAMQEILTSQDDVYLLHGTTGSGKTEVYLQLAAKALAEGRQVLILVPEISLTPQMIERVASRFGSSLAIYHSGLNAQQKYEQYRKVMTGKAEVVVGTRSAVFLPFHDLGLIVMDEEQDGFL
jgi:primosomal protein N' (replication factor Y)